MNSVNLNEKFGNIHHLSRRIMHHQRAEEHGPTQAQKRILAALSLQDGIATRELAFILGIRVPSLNETLSKLEQAELVTREQSEEDRRVMIIKLTEGGREAAADKPTEVDLYSVFSEEEKTQLGEYLDRLIDHLEETAAPFETEDRERWEQAVRSRMGDEGFEEWMARAQEMGMRGGPRGHHGGHRPHHPHEGFKGHHGGRRRPEFPDENRHEGKEFRRNFGRREF